MVDYRIALAIVMGIIFVVSVAVFVFSTRQQIPAALAGIASFALAIIFLSI